MTPDPRRLAEECLRYVTGENRSEVVDLARALLSALAELEQVKKERDEALGAAECSSECEGAYFARMQAAEAELEQVKKEATSWQEVAEVYKTSTAAYRRDADAAEAELEQVKKERDEARDFLRTQTMMREAERDRLEVVKQKLLVDWRRAAGERDRLAEAAREFIATMGRKESALHGPNTLSGFTAASSDAARKLEAALASMEGGGEKKNWDGPLCPDCGFKHPDTAHRVMEGDK